MIELQMATDQDSDEEYSAEDDKPSIGSLELLQRGQSTRVKTASHDVQAVVHEEDELTEDGEGAMIMVTIRFPGETGADQYGHLKYWTEADESSPVLGWLGKDYDDEVIESLEVVSDE